MKYLLVSLIIVTGWSSCAMDYTATANIVNASTGDIKITFYYSKHFMDSAYQSDSAAYRSYIKYLSGRMGMPFQLDTIKLIAITLIKPDQTLEVTHTPGGIGIEPEYGQYDSISIHTGNKLITRSANQIPEIFKKNESGLWIWKIE